MNNEPIKCTVKFITDLPESIEVRKKSGARGAYLPKSLIITDKQYNEIREGETIEVAAPKWLLAAQDVI